MTSQLQHYVPRFILRRFGSGKKHRVHAFDKHTAQCFSRPAQGLAAEHAIYDFDLAGAALTIEPSLAKLEGAAGEYVARIVQERRLDLSDETQRQMLSSFLAVQLVRTRATLLTQRDAFARMEEYLRAEGVDDSFFAPDPMVGGGENAEKALQASLIADAPRTLGPSFADKDWVLLRTNRRYPFWIGDHPLTMFNPIDHSPRGNLGVNVEGIELYFPLAPDLALAMYCPSHQALLVERIGQLRGPAPVEATSLLAAFRDGTPLESIPANVEHFNSLQVAYAERFVFSIDSDFALARSMCDKDPDLRHGQRVVEATGKF